MAIKCTWDHHISCATLPPHILRNPPHILRNPPHILRNPPTASIISFTSKEATKLEFGGCRVDVWIVSGGYLKGVLKDDLAAWPQLRNKSESAARALLKC